MAPTVDALAAHCRVIAFSLCDEPTSGFCFDPARGIDNYLLQIEEALDRARVSQAVLIGVSYGGLIATEFAARRPARVSGLVLASALPPDWTPDRRARFYLRAPRLLSPLFVAAAPFRMRREMLAAFPGLFARIRFNVRHGIRVVRAFLSPTRMAARVRMLQNYTFADPRLVRAPALIITGEDHLDRVVRTQLTRSYLERLPVARHVVLQGTGHIGLVTKPDKFAELVEQFASEIANHVKRVSA